MKKILPIIVTIIMSFAIFTINTPVYATEKVIDSETESKIIEIKENQAKSLKDYQDKYGSETYGLVAYILYIVLHFAF